MQVIFSTRMALIAITLSLLTSCGFHEDKRPATSNVSASQKATFSWIKQNVLDRSCNTCHEHGTSGDIPLMTFEDVMANGNFGGMTGHNPDNQDIYKDLQSGRMPWKRPRLPEDQVQAVHDWISQGMPKN